MPDSNESEHTKRLDVWEKDLWDRQRSNVEKYDAVLISVSTALLGGSVSLSSDLASSAYSTETWALYCSWICLAASIALVLFSFLIGNQAISAQATSSPSERFWERVLTCIQWFSGLLCIIGLAGSVYFMCINNQIKKVENMKNAVSQAQLNGTQVPPPGDGRGLGGGRPKPTQVPTPSPSPKP